MPNCIYCGKPAGFFRRYHVECRAQFDRATGTIPVFFEKLLESMLPADRFEQLLREVAATFHIGPDQLRRLSVEGINAMVSASLAHHLMTIEDEDRILEIAGALGFSSSDIPGLDDRLVKIGVLRDLEDGIVPDRVTVVGPMPFELERRENIVWIFNNVKSYRTPKAKDAKPQKPDPAVQRDVPIYFPPSTLGKEAVPTKGMIERAGGDLMVTNRHIFVLSSERSRKIPFSKLGALNIYSDGFEVGRPVRDDNQRAFIVDDPWFAANLIGRLIRLSSHGAPSLEGNDADMVDEAH